MGTIQSFGYFLLVCGLAQAQFDDEYSFYQPDYEFMPMDSPVLSAESSNAIRAMEEVPQNSIWGHKFMQGGAGEGSQFLMPDGQVANKQEVKTDAVLPAYCEPPNPCPVGYTSEDGCLESFTNSAEFSQSYQERQDCMCDQEHMFNCPQKAPENNVMHMSSLGDQQSALAAMEAMLESNNIQDLHKGMMAKKMMLHA